LTRLHTQPYNHLVDAFGSKGLQAKIIQTAQEAIKINANTTLAHLSNGAWQIDLEENDQKTELEILARDLSQPGNPLRLFECLSGGEKFLVAVSLAVAIGQSISGGRTVDTLVIDEGFGNLDQKKRPLMVNELHRLSEDVLKGGRVIVVSHQEDVCEEFGSRYRISKEANGYTRIELNSLQ
jgi:exonuclease SbcC